jgi:hypothetical protein
MEVRNLFWFQKKPAAELIEARDARGTFLALAALMLGGFLVGGWLMMLAPVLFYRVARDLMARRAHAHATVATTHRRPLH